MAVKITLTLKRSLEEDGLAIDELCSQFATWKAVVILSEPTAHEIALMKKLQHKELMEGFATVAEAFIFDGSILA